MRVAFLVVYSLVAVPAHAETAAGYLDTARQLAARGHCEEAMRLRPLIERLDPELARTKFSSDPAIAACLDGTAPPPAPAVQLEEPAPAPSAAPEAPPAPPSQPHDGARCRPVGAYIEPSVFVAAGTPGVGELQRIGFGVMATDCDASTGPGISVRLGATFSLRFGTLGFGPSSGAGGGSVYAAGGGELEVDSPLGGSRAGVRVGVDSYDGSMVTAGVRWRYGHLGVGADAFFSYGTTYDPAAAAPRNTQDGGVLIGAGYEAHPGVLGAGGFVLASAIVAVAAIAVATGRGN